jgi:hypothetical protein
MAYYVGLDLGQAVDYTALAVIQTPPRDPGGERHLRHLERYPLQTSYTDIASGVAGLMADLLAEDKDSELLVDAGGVGRAVMNILRDRGLRFIGVNIHGGETTTSSSRTFNVPKKGHRCGGIGTLPKRRF